MAPMEGMDVPNYPFEKISMNVSGPYEKTPRDNIYISILTNWVEAFAVPYRKAKTVADLIMGEIFPRYGAPVCLVTDNGPENVNYVMREVATSLNMAHITTSTLRATPRWRS